MQVDKIAYIIIVYKDVQALALIIKALQVQTKLPDEIIIAEDGNDPAMKAYIETIMIEGVVIKHTSHEDKGWQKNKSLNNALRAAESDYLIFNDEDCLPYPEVVASHAILAKENRVLCGRRVNPGKEFGTKLREGSLSLAGFKKHFFRNYFALKKDGIGHYDEGIYIHPKSLLFKLIQKLSKSRTNAALLGCCWSIHKKELEKINGFDEDFNLPTVGCDTDVERRLRHFGLSFYSCRNAAITIHLWHEKVFDAKINKEAKKIMQKNIHNFVCKNGLTKKS